MPIPQPTTGESESAFVSRCVSFLIDEGREKEQAVAICYDIWRKRKNKAEERPETARPEYAEPESVISTSNMYEESDKPAPSEGTNEHDLDDLLPVD